MSFGKKLLSDSVKEASSSYTEFMLESSVKSEDKVVDVVEEAKNELAKLTNASFFMPTMDPNEKQEVKEEILEGEVGIESIYGNFSFGMEGSTYKDVSDVERLFKASSGLDNMYLNKYYKNMNIDGYKNNNIDKDTWFSARVELFSTDIPMTCAENYVVFYGIDKPAGKLKTLKVPNGFKLGKSVDTNNLAPLYVENITEDSFTVVCIPLEKFNGDNDSFVKAVIRLDKKQKGIKFNDIKAKWSDMGKVWDGIYKVINPYLSNFKVTLKRFGSKGFTDLVKQGASAGGATGVGGGTVAGMAIGAVKGASVGFAVGGPIGFLLGGGIGAAGGAGVGALGGLAVGTGVGAVAGAALYPAALGINIALVKNREKTLNTATFNIISLYEEMDYGFIELLKAMDVEVKEIKKKIKPEKLKPGNEFFGVFGGKKYSVLTNIDFEASIKIPFIKDYYGSVEDLKESIGLTSIFETDTFEVIGRNNQGFSYEYDEEDIEYAIEDLKEGDSPSFFLKVLKSLKKQSSFTKIKEVKGDEYEHDYSKEKALESIKYFDKDCLGSVKDSLREATSGNASSKVINKLKQYIQLSEKEIKIANDCVNEFFKCFKIEEVK